MISVVIPSYRNKEMLLKNLKHNLVFLNNCEVIVVNDYPSESLKKDLRKFKINLIETEKNLGFSGAMDKGIRNASGEIIFLLNSDVVLHNDNFQLFEKSFKLDTSLFGITFAQKEHDGSIVGKNVLYWKKGFLQHSKAKDMSDGPNGWLEGGASLMNKAAYLHIGGFDQLYNPFYWEDIDLSYRAKKAGFRVKFSSQYVVDHSHESTISAYWQQKQIQIISYRNQLICIWKNITDINLLASHILYLVVRIIKNVLKMDWVFLSGFFEALKQLKPLIQRRMIQKNLYVVKDKALL